MAMIFQSRAMLHQLERARKYARCSVAVLITGESGTGKELMARMLHEESPRRHKPFIRINCAALPESLIESELFGHEPGAFTGAVLPRLGRFEQTGEGTLFLDEVGELPLTVQAKLLRVLEEREFHRVGGSECLTFQGRVVAATNRDLQEEIQEGRFREDLFHRLNILTIRMPTLRERKEDIPLLVQHFIRMSGDELDHAVKGVTRTVMQKLCDYDWPGNIRELKNVLLRSCILASSETIEEVELPGTPDPATLPVICRQDHPEELTELPEAFARLSLAEIERRVILHRLRCFHGNKTEAAAALGVTPRTLRNKVQLYQKLRKAG
jgi:DNA-binding NtrC family response regulator